MKVLKLFGGWQGVALVLLLAGAASADETPPTSSAKESLKIVLGEWREDVPANVTRIVIGGRIEKDQFPALSSDQSRIALLYFADHPMTEAYPVFEIWSTKTLKLLRRIPLVPSSISEAGHGVDVHAPEVVEAVKRQIVEVNRVLGTDGYRQMEVLYDAQAVQGPLVGFENFGKRIDYSGVDGSLVITSSTTGRIQLKLSMPVIPTISGSEDPLNDCEVRGAAEQAWYAPESWIIVVRMTFISARDGCDQPEQWFVKRLQ